VSLAKVLKDIRNLRGHTLREVEKSTGISNAYLSQLERGDASRPAPDKLQSLAEFYGVPYTDLMREAGYLEVSEGGARKNTRRASAVQSALMSEEFSPDEEDLIVKYIEFLRFQRKSSV
jgi:transcriptional regulator with XRE-family HTH domain